MRAKDYLKLNRMAAVELRALDEYLLKLCGTAFDWRFVNMYDIPLLAGTIDGHEFLVNLSLPMKKVKYWIDGTVKESDDYHGFSEEELAIEISNWSGRNFLYEIESLI